MPMHSILSFAKLVFGTDTTNSTISYHILKSLGYCQCTPKQRSQIIVSSYIYQYQHILTQIIPTDLIQIVLLFYHFNEIALPTPLIETEFHSKYSIDQQDPNNNDPNPVWIHSGQACAVTDIEEKHDNNKYALYMMKRTETEPVERHKKLIYMLQQCRDCKNIVNVKDFCITQCRTYQIVQHSDNQKGNDLFDAILRKNTFNEFDAVNIIKDIVNGLKYMHSLQYVHSNLTPDNLRYYGDKIKIDNFKSVGDCCADNGLLKSIPFKCVAMFAAPEIIELATKRGCDDDDVIDLSQDIWLQIISDDRKGYNMSADIWSLGVIMYTILCGYPPFLNYQFINAYHSKYKMKLFRLIKEGRYEFHKGTNWDNISDDAKDLISKLLVIDKRKRLNATEILQHSWIANNVKKYNYNKYNYFGLEYKDQLRYWQLMRTSYHFKLSIVS